MANSVIEGRKADAIQGGDTRMKNIFCGRKHWQRTLEGGEVGSGDETIA